MIERNKDKSINFICDGLCGAEHASNLCEWGQALMTAKLDGWEHRKIQHRWQNFCPACVEVVADPVAEVAGVYFRKGADDA